MRGTGSVLTAPHRDAGADDAEESLRAVVLDRVRLSLGEAFGTLEIVAVIPSVTDFVFRARVDGVPVVVKCCHGGLSIARLVHLAEQGVDVAALGDRWRNALAFSPEGVSLRWLAPILTGHAVVLPRVLHEDRDVLVVEDLRTPSGDGVLDRRLLEGLWEGLSHVWRRSADTDEVRALSRLNGARSVESTFRRKFRLPDPSGVARDQFRRRGDWAVFAGLRDVVAGAYPPVGGRPGILYGDLKPEHLIPRPAAVGLIDPAVRLGEPAEDLARFLVRAACSAGGWGPGAAVDLIDSAAVVARDVSPRLVLRLMAMDWVNILSTWQLRRRARAHGLVLTEEERVRCLLLHRALLRRGPVDVLELARELSDCAGGSGEEGAMWTGSS